MLVRLVQNLKVSLLILVTLSGIVILVRLLQWEKAASPMLVTLSGKWMLVKPSLKRKADFSMLVVPSGTKTTSLLLAIPRYFFILDAVIVIVRLEQL